MLSLPHHHTIHDTKVSVAVALTAVSHMRYRSLLSVKVLTALDSAAGALLVAGALLLAEAPPHCHIFHVLL